MSTRTELSRKMNALENQLAKIFKPAPITCIGSLCSHPEVDGVCPHGCPSREDRKFITDLFKTKIVSFTFGLDSSLELKKGVRRMEVTCTQGNQSFKVLRKGDYLVKSSEEGEEFLAKLPKMDT